MRERYPRRIDVPLLLTGALLLLPFGLLLPTVSLSKIGGISNQEFSVVTGILNLAREGNPLLALIVFVFSFLFPIVKLTTLFVLWFRRLSPESTERSLLHLRALGKWSMLDVFVVAVFTGSVQFGFLARADPRYGLYLFSGAVLLSMVATFLLFRLARVEAPEVVGPRGPSLVVLPVAFLALLFLMAGFAFPLMETRKWVFWKVEYSIVTATLAMAREGQHLLAAMMTLFVVVIPTVALSGQVLLVLVRRAGRRSGRLHAILEFLDRWTMMDVFALGLLVVLVKIGGVADVSPRVGLGCLVCGVLFSGATSWLIRG